MIVAQECPTTFPSMPTAPQSWTDPAAFGYFVGVLLVAALVWSYFQEKRLNRQTKRLNAVENRTANAQHNAFVAALAVNPDAAVAPGDATAADPAAVVTRPTTSTEPTR
jgi:hypothetical protein